MKANDMRGRERVFAYLLIALSMLAFFYMNVLTPMMRDDWVYTVSFVTHEQTSSLRDILQSLSVHYIKTNGRLVVHFLAFLFFWWGKTVFNIINTVAFAGLITLIYFHAYGTLREFRPYVWLSTYLALWVLTPVYGESFLWVTGAANYLYGMLIILLYLIPFRRLFDLEEPVRGGAFRAAAALLGGVLAGWTNEHTGGALIVLLTGLLIWRRLERKPLPAWLFTGLIGSVTGFCIMFFAPAELKRLNEFGGWSRLWAFIWRVGSLTYRVLLLKFWPGIVLYLALLVLFLRRHPQEWRKLVPSLLLLMTGLASFYAVALTPHMPLRTFTGPFIFFLISALLLYRAAGEPRFRTERARIGAVSLCAVCLLASYALAVRNLSATAAEYDARMADVAEQISRGERALVVAPYHSAGSRFNPAPIEELSTDPGVWPNVGMAYYLGVDSIVIAG